MHARDTDNLIKERNKFICEENKKLSGHYKVLKIHKMLLKMVNERYKKYEPLLLRSERQIYRIIGGEYEDSHRASR